MSTSTLQSERFEPEASHLADHATVVVIEATSAWRMVDFRELVRYRDLLRFLIWRSVKARYAQSVVGIGWAVIQPLFQMITFTLVFGRIAGVQSEGVPYAAFSLIGLIPWTYFSGAVTSGASSLVSNSHMISKIYFPRIILPLGEVLGKLIDFAIAMLLGAVVLAYFGAAPNAGILMLPYLILLMVVASLGICLWLSALAIQFRDVNHALTFTIQLLMYASPVIYPTSSIPESHTFASGLTIWPRTIFALNPMVGVIEGFRSALLGTRPMPYDWIALGTLTSAIALVTGALYFRSRERLFADVA